MGHNQRKKRSIDEEGQDEKKQKRSKPPLLVRSAKLVFLHTIVTDVQVPKYFVTNLLRRIRFSLFCVEFLILSSLAGYIQLSRRSCVLSIQNKAHASLLRNSYVFSLIIFDFF